MKERREARLQPEQIKDVDSDEWTFTHELSKPT